MLEFLFGLIMLVVLVFGLAFFFKLAFRKRSASPEAISGRTDIFTRAPLLNKSEISVLAVLDDVVSRVFAGRARVFAQVSYGEFLRGKPAAAHARINSKRADFLIADRDGKVLVVVEYQGDGHYGKSEAARARAEVSDDTKREALSSAGIPLVEIPARFDAAVVDRLIRAAAAA